MCLYPKLIENKKYKPNKKNGGNVPTVTDARTLLIPVGCQKCIECKKQKANGWRVRLEEEIRTKQACEYVTLTFSNESIKELTNAIWNEDMSIQGYALDNAIAKLGVRRFLERWRKKHKKSVKHWLVTELGHEGTENIHLHGLIWTDQKADITNIWKYGWVYTGDYVNELTVNYITKYVLKMDADHTEYNAKILTSAGIGSNYTKRLDAKINKYKEEGTKETYTTRQGMNMNLPVYWRNKIYTEEEREKLWIEKLDKEERWVLGNKISIKEGIEGYQRALERAQRKNKKLGYGDGKKDWEKEEYEHKQRWLMHQKRLK